MPALPAECLFVVPGGDLLDHWAPQLADPWRTTG